MIFMIIYIPLIFPASWFLDKMVRPFLSAFELDLRILIHYISSQNLDAVNFDCITTFEVAYQFGAVEHTITKYINALFILLFSNKQCAWWNTHKVVMRGAIKIHHWFAENTTFRFWYYVPILVYFVHVVYAVTYSLFTIEGYLYSIF